MKHFDVAKEEALLNAEALDEEIAIVEYARGEDEGGFDAVAMYTAKQEAKKGEWRIVGVQYPNGNYEEWPPESVERPIFSSEGKKSIEKKRMKELKNIMMPNGLANAYRKRELLKDYE